MGTVSTASDELEYASIPARFGAHLIDSILLGGIFWVFAEMGVPALIVLWFVFAAFYIFMLEGVWTNQTVGKYALKMRVATNDGSPAKIRHALARNIVGAVGLFFGLFGLLVGAFAIHQSDTNKRIGDSMARTVVVYCDD